MISYQKLVTDSSQNGKHKKNEIKKLQNEIVSLKINNLTDNLEEINGLSVPKRLLKEY